MIEWRRQVTLRGWSKRKPSHPEDSQDVMLAPGVSSKSKSPVAADAGKVNRDSLRNMLGRTIEGEIIPRLMLSHQPSAEQEWPAAAEVSKPDSEDIIEFSAQVLRDDGSALVSVHQWLTRGATFEMLCLDLLSPAAKHMGDLWTADLLDFTDVTLGIWRLQQLMQDAAMSVPADIAVEDPRKRVLLSTAPGEQHSFGISMVAEFFRRAGWEVIFQSTASADSLDSMVRDEWFAVVAISVSAERRLESLAQSVKSIRNCARNKSVVVMVGGRVFSENPELVGEVGADACSKDAAEAVHKAEILMRRVSMLS